VSRRAALLALGLLSAPGALAAQATVYFYVPDTALTILTNRAATAQLQVYGVSGVSAYKITVFMDPSRVQLVAADTLPGYQLNPPTITANGEAFTLQGSGVGTTYSSVVLANLKFHMDTLAQIGSLVSIRVDSLVDGLGTNVTAGARTGLLNICQALQIGGDVSGDRQVNSRDALIVLTAAVGLPVTGFELGRPADVDQDLQVTSRDALFILGYGIGLASGGESTGTWLTNRCAPLAPAPSDMVFWRSGSLYKIVAADTVPVALGVTGVADYYARWSPDGSKLAFTGSITTYGYEVMTVNADGTALDTLTLNTSGDFAPDWSPDGSQVAFVSSRVSPQSIFVMNADGTGQTQVTTGYVVYDVAWSPNGKRLAFTGYSVSACCTRTLWTVNTDGSGVVEVPNVAVQTPQDPVWSPSGDSLIYYGYGRGRVYKVSAAGDTVRVSRLDGSQDSPWWENTVHTFRSMLQYPYSFILRRIADGRHLRLTRGAGSGDLRAALRRTLTAPATYPDTVTVTPDSIQLLADSLRTLSVLVKNNDGSVNPTAPVLWRSRDTTVAKVDGVGIVTANKNAGITYVVATSGWRSDSTKVVVAVTLSAVNAGSYHACALSADSLAYCWGYNAYGELGTGTTANSAHPMRVAGGLKFASITIGLYHTCGLTQAGAVYCWGLNSQGQLGTGNTTNQSVPTLVTGGLTFAAIDAGSQFTCGVTTANAGYCWGDNGYAQLGDSTSLERTAPTLVKGPLLWASISAGDLHACGVTTGGAGYCWGNNGSGRLGDSTTVNKVVPTAVYGARVWSAISAGVQHTCAVESSTKAAYCWGYNGYYQLGDSTSTNRMFPTAVKGGLIFNTVSAGDLHTCGVGSANSPYCWGYNGYGQLGDNSTTTRRSPTAVSGGLVMVDVRAGQIFSCGVTPAGAAPSVVYCWGYNGYMQLGDGTALNRSTPARVVGQP
jgi:alpha-tubulin suppressor-like RCC1 family protein